MASHQTGMLRASGDSVCNTENLIRYWPGMNDADVLITAYEEALIFILIRQQNTEKLQISVKKSAHATASFLISDSHYSSERIQRNESYWLRNFFID